MTSERALIAEGVSESEACLESGGSNAEEQRRVGVSSDSIHARMLKLPLLGLLAGCIVLELGFFAAGRRGRATSEDSSTGNTLQLDSVDEGSDTCSCGSISLDKQSRPMCEARRLNQATEDAKLENWEHSQETAGHAPQAPAKSQGGKDDTESKGSVEENLQKFISDRKPYSGRPPHEKTEDGMVVITPTANDEATTTEFLPKDCIDEKKVLAMTMEVSIQADAEMPIVLLQPMLQRSFKNSVCESLQITMQACDDVPVRLAAKGARRLSGEIQEPSIEDTIPAAVAESNHFLLMAEVSNPSADALKVTMGANFLPDFKEEVTLKLQQEGYKQGMGMLDRWAKFGKVDMTESSTNSLEGNYESLGYGNVCRKSRSDDNVAGKGTKVVQPVDSIRTCSTICNTHGSGCFGFEYRYSEQRCELWLVPICYAQESPWAGAVDFECFRKCE